MADPAESRPVRDRPSGTNDEGPELAGPRARVHRSERRALDRALALRDEAARLLVVAEEQAAHVRDEATAEAAELRQRARAEIDAAHADAKADVERLQTEAAAGDAVRVGGEAPGDRPADPVAAAPDGEAPAGREADPLVADALLAGARAEAAAIVAEARADAERLAEASGSRSGGTAVEPVPPAVADGEGIDDDVQALVALVESVEAERDAIAAELTAVRHDLERLQRGDEGGPAPQ